jgi:hypothetical protein
VCFASQARRLSAFCTFTRRERLEQPLSGFRKFFSMSQFALLRMQFRHHKTCQCTEFGNLERHKSFECGLSTLFFLHDLILIYSGISNNKRCCSCSSRTACGPFRPTKHGQALYFCIRDGMCAVRIAPKYSFPQVLNSKNGDIPLLNASALMHL